uniref:VASt domain-containing protein n=1 Tax=Haptolina ericina TaxID=156174 RepID=A0A7S3F8G8_9EUKA|mmetsp:Transcript_56464/g.126073  ORF Transcript_56464/g.126073 Transcript_56464/m.126073 type:complete len:655 (+) Transcript_56464:35-1999(+)
MNRSARARLRYVFTVEDVRLSCGSALLQPVGSQPPTISLTWRSGRKQVFGGVVRAFPPQGGAGAGALWIRPVSLACSLTSSKVSGQKFEARPSELILRIEGAKAARKKLVGTLDLAPHASFERTSARLTVPLTHGAGSLQLTLGSVWLKNPSLDDDDVGSTSSRTSACSDATTDSCAGFELSPLDSPQSSSNLSSTPPAESEPVGQSSKAKLHPIDISRRIVLSSVSGPCASRNGSTAALPLPGRATSSGGQPISRRPLKRASSFGTISTIERDLCPKPGLTRRPSADAFPIADSLPQPGRSTEGGGCEAVRCTASAIADSAERRGSLFSVAEDAMEEVLRCNLPLSLDELEESFRGMDCEESQFGRLLCRRLGYMQVKAGDWRCDDSVVGQAREVNLIVKCPPKPLLPDTTRVAIRHRLHRDADHTLLLEREVCTLDVPYGESFCLQERWVAKVVHRRSANQLTTMPGDGEHDLQLQISSHVHFRARLMLHAKIKHHSVKKSRKVAALVAELLEEAHLPAVEEAAPGSRVGGAPQSEFTKLQERLESLLEEATFHKQHAQQLERENKRLQAINAYSRKSKRQLAQQVVALEATLQQERRDRIAMEEALTEAYSTALRQMVEHQESIASSEPSTTKARLPTSARHRRGGSTGAH